MDVLVRIKRLVLRGWVRFTEKARQEMDADDLTVCVMCGSRSLSRRRVSVRFAGGRTVSGVEAEVCAACGERYYDLEAMRRLAGRGM
jgi:YgiT-type zinc finger domain-containing protein